MSLLNRIEAFRGTEERSNPQNVLASSKETFASTSSVTAFVGNWLQDNVPKDTLSLSSEMSDGSTSTSEHDNVEIQNLKSSTFIPTECVLIDPTTGKHTTNLKTLLQQLSDAKILSPPGEEKLFRLSGDEHAHRLNLIRHPYFFNVRELHSKIVELVNAFTSNRNPRVGDLVVAVGNNVVDDNIVDDDDGGGGETLLSEQQQTIDELAKKFALEKVGKITQEQEQQLQLQQQQQQQQQEQQQQQQFPTLSQQQLDTNQTTTTTTSIGYNGLDLQNEMLKNQQVAINLTHSLLNSLFEAIKNHVCDKTDYINSNSNKMEVFDTIEKLCEIERSLVTILTTIDANASLNGSSRHVGGTCCAICGSKAHMSVMEYCLYLNLVNRTTSEHSENLKRRNAAKRTGETSTLFAAATRTQHSLITKTQSSCIGPISIAQLDGGNLRKVFKKSIEDDVKSKLKRAIQAEVVVSPQYDEGGGGGELVVVGSAATNTDVATKPLCVEYGRNDTTKKRPPKPGTKELQIVGVNCGVSTLKHADRTGRRASLKAHHFAGVNAERKVGEYLNKK